MLNNFLLLFLPGMHRSPLSIIILRIALDLSSLAAIIAFLVLYCIILHRIFHPCLSLLPCLIFLLSCRVLIYTWMNSINLYPITYISYLHLNRIKIATCILPPLVFSFQIHEPQFIQFISSNLLFILINLYHYYYSLRARFTNHFI